MLYSNYNFNEEFENANGNNSKRTALALTELSKLIVEDRESVISVLQKSGVNLEESATPPQIKRAIFRTVQPKSKRAKLITHRLSKLILAKNDNSLSSSFSNLVNTLSTTDKVAKKEKSGWFKDNAGSVGSLIGGLMGGILSAKGRQQVDQQVATMENPPNQGGIQMPPENKSNTGRIILFGSIGLAVIGLTIFLIRKSKNK